KRGPATDALKQIEGALDIRAARGAVTTEDGDTAPGWMDMEWLRGGMLPLSVEEKLDERPSWILGRLEETAVDQRQWALAAACFEALERRGFAVDEDALKARAWLAEPDARPALRRAVQVHPSLGAAACAL